VKGSIKYILSLFGLFFCLLPHTYSQLSVVDSLNLTLKTTTADTVRLRLLVRLSDECDVNDILKYAVPAVDLAETILSEKRNLSDDQKNRILKQKASALNNIGFIYDNRGNIEKALEYYSQSLKIQEGLGNKKGIASSLNNIGFIYFNQNDVEKALDYWKRCLKLQEEIGNKPGIALSLNNIGAAYNSKGDTSKILDYYSRSLKIREEIGDKRGIAESLNNIGAVYFSKANMAKALSFYTKSLLISKEIGDKRGIAGSYDNIGGSYFLQKKFTLATCYIDSSLSLSKELGFPTNIHNAEIILSKIDSAIGDFEGAFKHYKQAVIYGDSIANEETRKASLKNQLKYEYEKKEAVLKEQQEKERVLTTEKSRFQQIIIWSVALGFILVLVFAVFVYRSLKITHRQKKVIEEKQREILASIHYAKRIQTALLPTIKYIEKKLQRS
jgi:tetratricopeptide (TPR) repeat protein